MATDLTRGEQGKKLALISVLASGALAVANVTAGLLSRSHSVTAAGVEFAGDVLASLIVFVGMQMASRPPDADHPYGHGRFEILAGLLVGLILAAAGGGICLHAVRTLAEGAPPPRISGAWALVAAIVVKGLLSISKFRVGRRINSAALLADAWNDSVDILSAATALGALALASLKPGEFASADSWGAFAVGVIVIVTGMRVVWDASLELTDTMPPPGMLNQVRRIASEVHGVDGVEKCFARKTGFQYHVDLHIEVDPGMTVAQSHYIGHQVQEHIQRKVPFVAAVLVHVEPRPSGRIEADGSD